MAGIIDTPWEDAIVPVPSGEAEGGASYNGMDYGDGPRGKSATTNSCGIKEVTFGRLRGGFREDQKIEPENLTVGGSDEFTFVADDAHHGLKIKLSE